MRSKAWISKTRIQYLSGGILFGAVFPLIAFAIRGFQADFTRTVFVRNHQNDPLLWIIDTAPIILGLFAYWIGIKQEHLEFQVARNQLALDQFIASSRELLGVLNHQGVLEEHSAAWLEIFGLSSDEIRKQPLLNLIIENDRDRFSKALALVFETRKTGSLDFRVKDHQESERWISAVIEPIQTLKKAAIFAKDITSQKISEEAMILTSKMASLGEMSAGIAHEINNPLGIIFGKVELAILAIERTSFTPEQETSIQKVKDNLHDITAMAERVSKIIKGLKQFTRNDIHDGMQSVDVNQIILESIELCKDRFKASGTQLFFDQTPIFQIECHLAQISQIIINLMGNAHDAIERTANKWVKISIENSEGHVRFRVSDSGLGIPKNVLDKIMTPFFTTKGVGKGTGLGLNISRKIAEAHGGSLIYELYNGHTSFVLELPCKQTQSLSIQLAA